MEQSNQSKAFVTLKDHKVNFQNDPKRRLINPARSEIEKISKHYLKHFNNKIREKTQMNQWRNSKCVIEWFKVIKNKGKSSFTKFDIVEFYPSISKKRLSKAIKYDQYVTKL